MVLKWGIMRRMTLYARVSHGTSPYEAEPAAGQGALSMHA